MSGFSRKLSADSDSGRGNVKISCGGAGCFTSILIIVALWALIFGVTIGGKHYGVTGCDSTNGVQIDK